MKSLLAEVQSRLASLKQEEAKLKKVLATLRSSKLDKPKADHRTGPRTRRVRYKTVCTRCGNTFTVKRNPNGGPSFCHKPCTSNIYKKEQQEYKGKHPHHANPVTLLPGDPIRASH